MSMTMATIAVSTPVAMRSCFWTRPSLASSMWMRVLATSLRPLAANEMDDQDEDEAHAHQQQTECPQDVVLGRALGVDRHGRGERGGDGRGRRQQRRCR